MSWYREKCSSNLFEPMTEKGVSVKQMRADACEEDSSSCAMAQAQHEKLWPRHRNTGTQQWFFEHEMLSVGCTEYIGVCSSNICWT